MKSRRPIIGFLPIILCQIHCMTSEQSLKNILNHVQKHGCSNESDDSNYGQNLKSTRNPLLALKITIDLHHQVAAQHVDANNADLLVDDENF